MPDFAVILPAAGLSTRFGGGRSKLLETVSGKAVVRHSIAAFARRRDVKLIVIAMGKDDPLRQYVRGSSTVVVCDGGHSRAQSVRNALDLVPAQIQWVAVHDAARPLVSNGLIDRTLEAAVRHGAAAPATAVAQTIKEAAGPLPAKVERTIRRDRLWAMQTPQMMRRADLAEAFEKCTTPLDQVTDDAQLLELIGKEVWLIAGEEENLKITTRADLAVAEMFRRRG